MQEVGIIILNRDLGRLHLVHLKEVRSMPCGFMEEQCSSHWEQQLRRP